MVCRFGMSEALGPQTFGQSLSARFLQTSVPLGEERNYSEQTAQRIDAELQAMLGAEQARARQILTERRAVLEAIGARLLAEETLDQDDLAAVVAGAVA
jgi:cell division protease FtsH